VRNALLLLESGVAGPHVDEAVVLGRRAGVKAERQWRIHVTNSHAQVVAFLDRPCILITREVLVAVGDEHGPAVRRPGGTQAQRAVAGRVDHVHRCPVAAGWNGRGECEREERDEGEHGLESHFGCDKN
jgi:hypothetical protein